MTRLAVNIKTLKPFFHIQDKKMLIVKDREVSKVMEQLLAMQEEGQKENAALEVAEKHFRAVSAGLSTNEDGEEATLAGQMMTCKNEISKADTEAKQVRTGMKQNKGVVAAQAEGGWGSSLLPVTLNGIQQSRKGSFIPVSCIED